MQIPIGAEANFKGVIDLIEMKAIVWHDETMGAKYYVEAIPENLLKKAEAFRMQLIEVIAEIGRCAAREVPRRRHAHHRRSSRPAFARPHRTQVVSRSSAARAFKNKGVQTLLDAVVDYLPSPLDKPPVDWSSILGS